MRCGTRGHGQVKLPAQNHDCLTADITDADIYVGHKPSLTIRRAGTLEFRLPEVPIVAENGAKALLLNLGMKCSGISRRHSRYANAINRRGPEQLTNTTTRTLAPASPIVV